MPGRNQLQDEHACHHTGHMCVADKFRVEDLAPDDMTQFGCYLLVSRRWRMCELIIFNKYTYVWDNILLYAFTMLSQDGIYWNR